MYILGAHLSISKGIGSLQDQITGLNMDCCAFFLKSQRSFAFKPIVESDVENFCKNVQNPEWFVPHGSYLVNLATKDEALLEKGLAVVHDDLIRCKKLGIKVYNIHPGSSPNKKEGLRQLSNNLELLTAEHKDVTILIENMAGQGNVLCSKFEELKTIVDENEKIGICLDTAHLFGAGYDINAKTFELFDEVVGLKKLKAVHLNDSKCPLNSKKDRHESIGKGLIGIEPFKFIMNSEIFHDIPLVLETPNPLIYKEEIELLRSLTE